MGFAKIKGELTPRIGCKVRFSAPQDVHNKKGQPIHGEVVDEVWADESINKLKRHPEKCQNGKHCWGDYSFCAQLIKWENRSFSIRLAYYRRRCGEDSWEFASQMTVTSGWKNIKSLMEETLCKADWFQDEPPYPKK